MAELLAIKCYSDGILTGIIFVLPRAATHLRLWLQWRHLVMTAQARTEPSTNTVE